MQGLAPAFYTPPHEKLLAAGFRQSTGYDYCWYWEGATGGNPAELGGRFWIYLWFHKNGEIFIHHTNKPRAAENPIRTSVGTGAEFTALITRFGWKR